MSVLSYVLAFLAGLVNATGNVLNRKAARDEPDQAEFRLKLITDLMHRKVWLVAVGLMIVSFALAASALGIREWVAIGALTAGVIGLLALLDPRPGPATSIAPILWIAMSTANVASIVGLYLAARAHRKPAVRAGLLGIACGLGYGLTAAARPGFREAS